MESQDNKNNKKGENNKQELAKLTSILLSSRSETPEVGKDTNKYSAYGVFEDVQFKRADLKKAVDVMYKVVMEMNNAERNEMMFGGGFIAAKDALIEAHSSADGLDPDGKRRLQDATSKFDEKYKTLEPLIEFCIKMREIL